MRAMSKTELAQATGVSMSTLRRYLRLIEPQLPGYRRQQKMLTPLQVRIFCTHYCVEIE